MHSEPEYSVLIRQMLRAAQNVGEYVQRSTGDTEPLDVMRFCIRHGYVGYPLSGEKFTCGCWLDPAKSLEGPRVMEEVRQSLAIVVCFTDDPIPYVASATIRQKGTRKFSLGGFVSEEHRLLVITDGELFTPFDLAIEFLHEARHARHRLGEVFEGLPLLDSPELHEVRTWEFQLRILDACGGDVWRDAVRHEAERLAIQLTLAGCRPGDPYFSMSNVYHLSLDAVFGTPPSEDARQFRNLLVAMRSLFLLAEQKGIPSDIAHKNILESYHAWSRRGTS